MKSGKEPLLSLFIAGLPKAQPRPRKGKYGNFYNPVSADGWKAEIIYKAKIACKKLLSENPIQLQLKFYFKSKQIKWHISKPDIDNLIKSVMDALKTSRVYKDDCQVCSLQITKEYSDKDGCLIDVWEI